MAKKLLVVAGPTATGKTALAVELAQRLGGEVVSADSMQVYAQMPIATAQPSAAEQQAVPHHMVGVLPPSEPCSVARYADMARACIADINARGRLPILCGGSWQYINAVAEGLVFEALPQNPALRAQLEAMPKGAAFAQLQAKDPAAAARLHPNNHKRVLRALELCLQGSGITQQNERSRPATPPFHTHMLLLLPRDRAVLYARIHQRIAAMLAAGLEQEALALRQARAAVPGKQDTAAQAIGHKELEPYFAGSCTLPEAVAAMQQATRNYAKRQCTAFGRMQREWNARAPGSCVPLYIEDKTSGQTAREEGIRFANHA